MIYMAVDNFPACNSPLWDRIAGWEVVAAVLFIVAAWASVQISRMYLMVKIAQVSYRERGDEEL